MPLVLVTDTNPGEARWEDSSLFGGGGVPLSVQRGCISAENSSVLNENLSVSGIFTVFAQSQASVAEARDAGGVGRTQSSGGLAGQTTYINGGIGDEPGSSEIIDTGARPLYEQRFRIDAGLADCRFYCGFSPAEDSSVASATDNPPTVYFGLQFSPVSRGDTSFQIVGKSTSGGTQVVVDTGIAPVAGAIYRLRIDGSSTTSWTATLFQDGDGTPDFTTVELFSTTITDTNAIPVAGGDRYTGNISMTAVNAAVMSFTHYYWDVALRAGVQIS